MMKRCPDTWRIAKVTGLPSRDSETKRSDSEN